MSSDLETIKDHYAASARGDLPGMLACFAPDIAWTEMAGFPYAGTYIGPDEVRRNVFERLGVEWDSYDATPTELIDGGDGRVVALGEYSGVYKETGKAFKARFTHVWRLRDGKAYQFEQMTDTHVVREAMSA